jgi:PAS domain S-box-containing protein
MSSDLQDIFRLAAKYFYKKYKENGGSQAEIAEQLGITQSYVSAVMNGSRTASLELQNQLANILYGPFEEFLAVGRRIQNNLAPEVEKKPEPDESVEQLVVRLTHYIMDHQRIEKELEYTKNFYEEIIQNLQSGVLVTDKDDTIFFANRSMLEVSKIPSEKLLGANILFVQDKFSDMDTTQFSDKYLLARKSLEHLFYEYTQITIPNGSSLYLTGWLIPKVNDGKFNGMTCIIRDTTRSQELSKLLKLTLDKSPYAIGIVKQVKPGVYAKTYFTNKKMRQLFGQEHLHPTQIIIHESLDRCEKFIINNTEWRQFLQKNFTLGKKASFVIKHTNGRQYRWTSENIVDIDGKPWGRMAVVKETGRRRRNGDM